MRYYNTDYDDNLCQCDNCSKELTEYDLLEVYNTETSRHKHLCETCLKTLLNEYDDVSIFRITSLK